MDKQPMKTDQTKPTLAETFKRWMGPLSMHNTTLRTRLVLVMAIISIPLLLASNMLMSNRAEAYLRETSDIELKKTNTALVDKTSVWLTQNVMVLRQLATLPQIIAMDPEEQRTILRRTSQAFPHMYLVHTVDTNVMNVARSDLEPNKDYSGRYYFQRALLGESITFQVITGLTSGEPALTAAVPVWDGGEIKGAVAFASDLNAISKSILTQVTSTDDKMQTFVVDDKNQVIAHPNQDIANQFEDYSNYPPVKKLREGHRAYYNFTDANGVTYRAYLSVLSNGWGVITQQEQINVISRINQLRLMSLVVTLVAVSLMVGVSAFMIRRSLQPVNDLIYTANAISRGDLSRVARVERNDEIGTLAKAFNIMTARLRGTVNTLEQNVADRTRMIETSFEVSRRLSTILNMNDLLREVVNQLQSAFDYYHVHIYLFDEAKQTLVMSGGTGEAGRAMMARGHHIVKGKGLVGRAAETNMPVLVEDTHADPNWLPNPLLPDTQSEAAVPIAISDFVVGVLDVQQNRVGGLTKLDVELLQSIANQVAIAVQNAKSYAQVQERADREASIANIHQKLQQSGTVEDVLEVAVSELGKLLNARHTTGEIRIHRGPESKN